MGVSGISCVRVMIDTYYDFDSGLYDFSICTDDDTNAMGCGNYDGTQEQLDCLLENYALVNVSCCKTALEMS